MDGWVNRKGVCGRMDEEVTMWCVEGWMDRNVDELMNGWRRK